MIISEKYFDNHNHPSFFSMWWLTDWLANSNKKCHMSINNKIIMGKEVRFVFAILVAFHYCRWFYFLRSRRKKDNCSHVFSMLRVILIILPHATHSCIYSMSIGWLIDDWVLAWHWDKTRTRCENDRDPCLRTEKSVSRPGHGQRYQVRKGGVYFILNQLINPS